MPPSPHLGPSSDKESWEGELLDKSPDSGLKGDMGHRMIVSKDVHILIPRTHECVTLHGKRDFADMIKDLEMGKSSWTIQVGLI